MIRNLALDTYTRTDTKNTLTLIISHHPLASKLCLRRSMCVCVRCEYLTIYTRQLPVVCIRQTVKYNINFDSFDFVLSFAFESKKSREEEKWKKLTVRSILFETSHYRSDESSRQPTCRRRYKFYGANRHNTPMGHVMPLVQCSKRSALRRWATLESFWGIWIFMKWISGISSYMYNIIKCNVTQPNSQMPSFRLNIKSN